MLDIDATEDGGGGGGDLSGGGGVASSSSSNGVGGERASDDGGQLGDTDAGQAEADYCCGRRRRWRRVTVCKVTRKEEESHSA